MTERIFNELYADLYDHLYHDKDYEAECDLIKEVLRHHSQRPVKTILDLGCGTGGHAFPLARRGYRVTGVDRSPKMLALAQDKLTTFYGGPDRQPPVFHQADIRDLDLGEQFDAVIVMFAVLSYQLTNKDVLAALATVRRHLKPGGLFIAEVWYGPAVLAQRPGDRVKVISTPDGQIIRTASATLDTFRHLVEVRYHLWHLEGDRLIQETQEAHNMRYFFPLELSLLMNNSSLSLINITAFGKLNTLADESTWNTMILATLPCDSAI